MDKMFIACENAADRDLLVTILARNGYTVRHAKEPKNISKNTWIKGVQLWRGD